MKRAAACLLPLVAACHLRTQVPPAVQPLAEEGELHVYLQPFPADAARLSLSIASVSALRADGTPAALEVALPEVSSADAARQRLLAWGRVPAGEYVTLLVQLRRARLGSGDEAADLLVPEEPVRVELPLRLARGKALVVRVALRPAQAGDGEFDFAGAFQASALTPAASLIQYTGYVSVPSTAALTEFHRRAGEVTGVVPTGREPYGIALDERAQRLYVSLAGEDHVQVLDLSTGDELRRVPLTGGDSPGEVALTPDGRELLVVNRGSNTLAFVDVASMMEVGRVAIGEDPGPLLLDRGGHRAYVLARRTSDITVVDVANRTVASRVRTDAEPLRAQLDRSGGRLYVIHRGSVYMNVYSVPELALLSRIFVGLGASALKLDPRTDLVYVGFRDSGRIQVFDPASLLPIDSFEVPGPVSYLTIDGAENHLVAVVPSVRQVVLVDLTRREVAGALDLAREPLRLAIAGEVN